MIDRFGTSRRGKKKTIRGWLEWKNVAASCCRFDTNF